MGSGTPGSWGIVPVELPRSPASSGDAKYASRVAFGWQDGATIHLATDGTVVGSSDGRTWRQELVPPTPERSPLRVSYSFRKSLVLPDRTLLVGYTMTPADPMDVAHGDDESKFRPAVWSSRDHGATWASVESPAFDVSAEINAIAQTPHGTVAVGNHRPHGHSGPFTPALWRSTDSGDSWTELPLRGPRLDGDTSFISIAVLGEQIVVAGQHDYSSAVWTTADLAQWSDVTGATKGRVALVSNGARLVAFSVERSSNDKDGHPGWTTTDLARWDPIPRDPAVFGDGGGDSYTSYLSERLEPALWNGQFVVRGSVPTRSDPQFCFQDFATCQQVTDFIAVSDDGTTWRRVAAEDRGTDTGGTTFATFIAGSSPAALIALHSTPQPNPSSSSSDFRPPASTIETQLWRWSATGTPAAIPAAIPTTTAPPMPVLDRRHPELAVGQSARMQWSTGGCSGGLSVSGKSFVVAPPGLPDPQPDWRYRRLHIADGPSLVILGTVTRVSEDELSFAIEGSATTLRLIPGTSGGCM